MRRRNSNVNTAFPPRLTRIRSIVAWQHALSVLHDLSGYIGYLIARCLPATCDGFESDNPYECGRVQTGVSGTQFHSIPVAGNFDNRTGGGTTLVIKAGNRVFLISATFGHGIRMPVKVQVRIPAFQLHADVR